MWADSGRNQKRSIKHLMGHSVHYWTVKKIEENSVSRYSAENCESQPVWSCDFIKCSLQHRIKWLGGIRHTHILSSLPRFHSNILPEHTISEKQINQNQWELGLTIYTGQNSSHRERWWTNARNAGQAEAGIILLNM